MGNLSSYYNNVRADFFVHKLIDIFPVLAHKKRAPQTICNKAVWLEVLIVIKMVIAFFLCILINSLHFFVLRV